MNSLPKTVTRQRRDCDLNPGLLRLSPARLPLGYRATLCLCPRTIILQLLSRLLVHGVVKRGAAGIVCGRHVSVVVKQQLDHVSVIL